MSTALFSHFVIYVGRFDCHSIIQLVISFSKSGLFKIGSVINFYCSLRAWAILPEVDYEKRCDLNLHSLSFMVFVLCIQIYIWTSLHSSAIVQVDLHVDLCLEGSINIYLVMACITSLEFLKFFEVQWGHCFAYELSRCSHFVHILPKVQGF